MDALDELLPTYKELFNVANDIVHPLRAATGLIFDITAPISSQFGILSKFEVPANEGVPPEGRSAANRMIRTAEGGAYFTRRSVDGLNSSRLLVTATTATTGISTTTAELKRQTPSMGFDLRSVLHVPMGSSTQASLATDVRRRDYAVSLKVATTGAVYGAYHQMVGIFPALDGLRLTAAAEVMVSDLFRSPLTTRDAVFPLRVKGPSADPGLTYAAAIAGTSGDSRHSGVLALQQVRMGLPKVEAQYVHAASKHTTAVAAVEFNALTSESKASVGYRTRFPRTRSVFTASMTSDGGIRACFERALLSNVRGTIALDTTVIPNPPRRPGQEVGASVRLAIGPQPRINLELTPVLLRDAPRVWQK